MDITRSVVMVVSYCLVFDCYAPRLLVAQTPPLTAHRQPSAEPLQTLEPLAVTGRADDLVGIAGSASEGRVGQAQLETRPLLRPAEVLEVVPGLAVTQPSGSGKANQYFLCGFNLDHGTDFSTLVDGVPINFPTHAHGQGYMDLNWVILELVDYVTFRKGLYYEDVGDYSSAGAADFHLVKTLPEGLAKVETGQDDYYRGLLGWQAILRLQHPLSLGGLVPVVMGLAAAVGNGGVAWLLWGPGQEHTAIRLAYVHNRGDVVMSCAPVIAGVLITLSGRGVLDVAMALGVAVWMCCSMLRELLVAPKELLSPGTLSCWYASTGRISLWTEPSV